MTQTPSAHAAGSYAHSARTRYGSDSTHCRTGLPDLPTTIRAGNTFKLTEQRDTLLQTAKTRAAREPAEARFEPVTAIALGLKDHARVLQPSAGLRSCGTWWNGHHQRRSGDDRLLTDARFCDSVLRKVQKNCARHATSR